jgi:hypothetical protein
MTRPHTNSHAIQLGVNEQQRRKRSGDYLPYHCRRDWARICGWCQEDCHQGEWGQYTLDGNGSALNVHLYHKGLLRRHWSVQGRTVVLDLGWAEMATVELL